MFSLIAGNLCSLFAMVTDSVSSSKKTVKGVLMMQLLSQFFYGTGAIVLKGYSAAVQNAVSVLRNLEAMQPKHHKWFQWLLVGLGVGLGIAFNNRGVVGWLPILANLEYTLSVFHFQDNERALKIAFLINTLLYVVFNACIWNVVGAASNLVVVITIIIFLIRDRSSKQQTA